LCHLWFGMKTPINSALYRADIGPKLIRRLCPSRRCHAPMSDATRHYWRPLWARGEAVILVGALTFTGGPLEEPWTEPRRSTKPAAAVSHLGAQPTVMDPWVRIPLPSAPFRARRTWPPCSIAPRAELQRGQPWHWCPAPPRSNLSRPFNRVWPQLEAGYLFGLIKSELQIKESAATV
jgi:hypothetical protein